MATYNEKGLYDEQIDRVETKGSDTSAHDAAVVAEFDEAEQKRIVRRIDFRLVTLVGLMYCVSLMDRTNLSNAAIAGMNVELKMVTGYGYVSLIDHMVDRINSNQASCSPSSHWFSSSHMSSSSRQPPSR